MNTIFYCAIKNTASTTALCPYHCTGGLVFLRSYTFLMCVFFIGVTQLLWALTSMFHLQESNAERNSHYLQAACASPQHAQCCCNT